MAREEINGKMKKAKMPWLVFIATMVLYAFSMAPSLGSEDSAKWVVDSLMFGLPDAPGNILYLLVCSFWFHAGTLILAPVFGLFAWAVTFISARPVFIFEPASAVNMVSVLSGAGAAALVFSLLDRVTRTLDIGSRINGDTGRRLLIAAGTVFLFTLPSVWSSALEAGPAMFNIFLLCLSFWMLVRIHEGSMSSSTGILLWMFLMGLSFSQQYVVLFSLGFLLLIASFRGPLLPALRSNLGPSLLVFAVGLTVYIYPVVRPVLDPGLGHPVELFSRGFWEYFYGLDALRQSLPRGAGFFTRQIPLMLDFMTFQVPHLIVGILLLALFHFALVRVGYTDRGRMYRWGGLMIGILLVQLWLVNSRLGAGQAPEIIDPTLREHRNLEYAYLISILCMGAWVILGAAWLKDDLSRLLSRAIKRADFTERYLAWVPGTGLLTLVCLSLLLPVGFNWKKTSMAVDFVVADAGRNMLMGTSDDAILVVSGDREYYPVMYARNYLFEDTTRSVINYSRLADRQYIKRLDDISPPVRRLYPDDQVELLRNARLAEPYEFEAGKLKLNYPANTVLMVRDLAMLDIIRANEFERPLYFSHTLGRENLAGLERYVARRGMTLELLDHDPMTREDSSYYWRGQDNLAVDINTSSALFWIAYSFHTTIDKVPEHRRDRGRIMFNYARLYSILADAFLMRDNVQQAALNFRQTEFFDRDYKDRLFTFATWFAMAGHYEGAKQFAFDYFKEHPADPMQWAGLAKMALEKADSTAAAELLFESVKVDPDFHLGFTKLVRLYDAMGQKLMASAFLSRWVARHPGDEEARRLWEQYSSTKVLPPDFPD